MANIWELALLVLRTLPLMFTDMTYLLILGVVFVFVYRQYQKVHLYEKRLFGLDRINPLIDTATAAIYGIIGGLFATTLFVTLGVSLSDSGVAYLWITALLLMFIHPRFLCFSYAGGLVGLSSLIFGFPKVSIPSLMALVAILHLAESLLIAIDGYHNASPIYFKKGDQVVGGFSLQKFWPVPFVALLGLVIVDSGLDLHLVSMPDWWPLFSSSKQAGDGQTIIYMLFPVIAALGYSDLVTAELPKVKARRSALHLSAFSLILLALAFLADRYPGLAILAVLFSPLGHELVIYLGQKGERSRPPVFQADAGVMILAVHPGSPAEQMGLGPGDVIRSVNGSPVEDLPSLVQELSPWVVDPVFTVENSLRAPTSRTVTFRGKVPPLGIIPAPHPQQRFYMRLGESPVQRLWNRLRRKRK
ncbi:MAG TPA: PDZ domain-containing protein [Firmicutes bacterium]|nr:PDZ domain-containing protein [Bacillota bacterium]